MVEVTDAALGDPAVQRRLVELGFEPLPRIPQPEMLAFVREEKERWEPIIRATGARRD
jgi:hypothetical protein